MRHVTFSCERELGQSLWSQQVLSTMFRPGRHGWGWGYYSVWQELGAISVLQLCLSHHLKRGKWKGQKGRLHLPVLICVSQSIFIWLFFTELFLSAAKKTSGGGGCLSQRPLKIEQQNSTRSAKRNYIWVMFLESRQQCSSFWGCTKNPPDSLKNPIRWPTLLHLFPKFKTALRIRCRLEVLP